MNVLFDNINVKKIPFDYFYCMCKFNDSAVIEKLLDWFDSNAPWEYTQTDFYEQYEFDLKQVQLPTSLEYFVSTNFENSLLNLMERIFQFTFDKNISVIAHKLTRGQSIGIHNDFLADEESETHRLLLQINRNWSEEQGGILMFFDNSDELNITDALVPLNCSIQAFKISKISNHAVSEIHSDNNRYTIIYNFTERI